MTSRTTRRAALGAVLAAGATGIALIPAGAATIVEPVDDPRLDAGLFALIDEARQVVTRLEEASVALSAAEEHTEEVPWPQALIVTEDDTRIWKLKAGDRFGRPHLAQMKEGQAYGRNAKIQVRAADARWLAMLNDKDRAMVEIMAAKEVREDQLIAALDEWNDAKRVAEDRSGETAANERFEQLREESDDAYKRVADTRARTLSGILAKLAFIAPDFDDASASELPADMGISPEVLFSVAVDFKELESGDVLSRRSNFIALGDGETRA